MRIIPLLILILFGFSIVAQENKKHTPFAEDGWLSCSLSSNPNPERPLSHWLLYDLGTNYTLDSTYIWNYNTWGFEDYGAREVAIDYSLDGNTWHERGVYEFEKASGSYKYKGFQGPNLGEITARYILLTIQSNWGGGGCAGLSEVKFKLSDQTTPTTDQSIVEASIRLVPNPTNGPTKAFVFSDHNLEFIRVLDVAGKTIQEIPARGRSSVDIDLSDYPEGMYLARFQFETGIVTERIVKME